MLAKNLLNYIIYNLEFIMNYKFVWVREQSYFGYVFGNLKQCISFLFFIPLVDINLYLALKLFF